MNLVAKTEKTSNNLSGLNLSKEAHDNIAEVRRLLTEKGVEIDGVKNSKKELFEFAASELLTAIREKMGIKVEDDIDNELESVLADN